MDVTERVLFDFELFQETIFRRFIVSVNRCGGEMHVVPGLVNKSAFHCNTVSYICICVHTVRHEKACSHDVLTDINHKEM